MLTRTLRCPGHSCTNCTTHREAAHPATKPAMQLNKNNLLCLKGRWGMVSELILTLWNPLWISVILSKTNWFQLYRIHSLKWIKCRALCWSVLCQFWACAPTNSGVRTHSWLCKWKTNKEARTEPSIKHVASGERKMTYWKSVILIGCWAQMSTTFCQTHGLSFAFSEDGTLSYSHWGNARPQSRRAA